MDQPDNSLVQEKFTELFSILDTKDDGGRGLTNTPMNPVDILKHHAFEFQRRAGIMYNKMKAKVSSDSLSHLALSVSPFCHGCSCLSVTRGLKDSLFGHSIGEAIICAIELGGTSCRVCIAGTSDLFDISRQASFKTEDPSTTLSSIYAWIRDQKVDIHMFCIGSFGPIDPNPFSPTYGSIRSTPKLQWQNFNLVDAFKSEFGENIKISFSSDVHGPAITELIAGKHGNHVMHTAYVTVGTGIGVGFSEKSLRSFEGGHMFIKRHPDDTFPGTCPYHKDCLEGMASGSAIAARLNVSMAELVDITDSDPVWDIIGYYLAQLCYSIALLNNPDVIIFSGGVMLRTILFTKMRHSFYEINNNYQHISRDIEDYIVPSKFGNDIGLLGTVQLYKNYNY